MRDDQKVDVAGNFPPLFEADFFGDGFRRLLEQQAQQKHVAQSAKTQ